jgi:predicted amidohydrolase YtcJ
MTSTRIDGATVWTGVRLPNGSVHVTDSVLFREGRIVACGASARKFPADVVVDGEGAFVAPAFADGHVHPLFGGLESQFAPVRDLASPELIALAVGAWARAHPDAEWVRGEGFDPTVAPGGVFHAAWLDAQVPDRAVALRAADYHTVWVNSRALERAGIGVGVAQPVDGEIVLNEAGAPIGTLREWGAWHRVYDLLPDVPLAARTEALRSATADFAAAGIAWVQDAWSEPADVEAWIRAAHAGVLSVRADLALWADAQSWRDQVDGFVSSRAAVAAGAAGQVSASTVKFFADGVIESGTGALLEPYCDCPHSRGMPIWSPDELCAAVAEVDRLGFTPHIHGIGDRGVRMALDAFAYAARVNAPRDRRWVIAHNQLVDARDLPRFSDLGVVANFEPYWAKLDSWQVELTSPRLGHERQDQQYRIASALRSGAVVSFGSDWPVTTYSPLAGIQVAVTRRESPDDPSWMPEECLTVDEALTAYTCGVAHQAGRDDAGVIRPGAVADLVLLDADPRAVDPMAIEGIGVLGTWVSGERTHG